MGVTLYFFSSFFVFAEYFLPIINKSVSGACLRTDSKERADEMAYLSSAVENAHIFFLAINTVIIADLTCSIMI